MSEQSGRERAIAAFNAAASAPNTQSNSVANPSSVSPEEMSAVKAPSAPAETPPAPKSEAATEPKDGQKATDEVTKPKADDPLSQQYALLARKEKALRAKVQEQKAKEDAIKAQEDSLKAKEAEMQAKYVSKDKLSQDPLAALTELGITYEQLTQLILNQPKPEDAARLAELNELKAEIKKIQAAQENAVKASAEQQTKAYEQAVAQIRNETEDLVAKDESYEMIRTTGSTEDVVELIKKTFDEEGRLMTVEEAALAVEEYLVEEAIKLAKAKKIQAKIAPAPAKPAEAQKAKEPEQPQAKTLSNTMGTNRPMTARERAIAAFKGDLK